MATCEDSFDELVSKKPVMEKTPAFIEYGIGKYRPVYIMRPAKSRISNANHDSIQITCDNSKNGANMNKNKSMCSESGKESSFKCDINPQTEPRKSLRSPKHSHCQNMIKRRSHCRGGKHACDQGRENKNKIKHACNGDDEENQCKPEPQKRQYDLLKESQTSSNTDEHKISELFVQMGQTFEGNNKIQNIQVSWKEPKKSKDNLDSETKEKRRPSSSDSRRGKSQSNHPKRRLMSANGQNCNQNSPTKEKRCYKCSKLIDPNKNKEADCNESPESNQPQDSCYPPPKINPGEPNCPAACQQICQSICQKTCQSKKNGQQSSEKTEKGEMDLVEKNQNNPEEKIRRSVQQPQESAIVVGKKYDSPCDDPCPPKSKPSPPNYNYICDITCKQACIQGNDGPAVLKNCLLKCKNVVESGPPLQPDPDKCYECEIQCDKICRTSNNGPATLQGCKLNIKEPCDSGDKNRDSAELSQPTDRTFDKCSNNFSYGEYKNLCEETYKEVLCAIDEKPAENEVDDEESHVTLPNGEKRPNSRIQTDPPKKKKCCSCAK